MYIPEYWANLETYLNKNGWYIKKILGDGFYLLSSSLVCTKDDHQIDITIDNAKQLILEQLIDNHDMYVTSNQSFTQTLSASVIDPRQVLGLWWLLSPGTSMVAQIRVVLTGH